MNKAVGEHGRLRLGFAAFVLVGANDGALGVLLPGIQRYYSVDKATVALIFLCGTAGFLAAALVSGLLLERLGTRRLLGLGAGVFGLGAALVGLLLPFPALLAAVLLLYSGVGALDAGLNAYIAGLPDNTARLNYLHAFYGVGALLGPLLASGVTAVGLGWQLVYWIWLVLGVALLGGIWLLFQGSALHRAAAVQSGNVLADALKLRAVWPAAVFLMLYVGGEASLGNWSYSLLTEVRGIAPLPAGWTVSGFWLGLTLGRLALGRVSRRLGDQGLVQLCLAGVVTGLLLVWLSPLPMPSALGLWLTGFALGPIYPTTIALISRIAPARLLPAAVGFLSSAGGVGGALLPWAAGNLAQALGLSSLLPYVIALTALMLLCWWVLQAVSSADAGAPEAA